MKRSFAALGSAAILGLGAASVAADPALANDAPALPPSLASLYTTVVHPGRSIDAALDGARPGDVIRLRAGTYTENVSSGVDGTASKPITMEPYPGDRPVLHVKLTLSGASYLTFRNLLFEGSSRVSGTAIRLDFGAHGVTFEGNEVRNYRRSNSAQAFLLGRGLRSAGRRHLAAAQLHPRQRRVEAPRSRRLLPELRARGDGRQSD